jgi:hypothetical protein
LVSEEEQSICRKSRVHYFFGLLYKAYADTSSSSSKKTNDQSTAEDHRKQARRATAAKALKKGFGVMEGS